MISDATGETLIAVGRAVAAQYVSHRAVEHIYPMIRTREQLDEVLRKIAHEPGIVLHTILNEELSRHIEENCNQIPVPSVSVIEPVLTLFQTYLGEKARRRASAQHVMDDEYFRRIEALNYSMDHDDGLMVEDLDQAEVILVGVSRASKTPTSIYLANRGIKTANVPLIVGLDPPPQLIAAGQLEYNRPLIVGLIASAEHISHIRKNRALGEDTDIESYSDRIFIREELNYARQICNHYHWPMIDVTRRSIEETAAAILTFLSENAVSTKNESGF